MHCGTGVEIHNYCEVLEQWGTVYVVYFFNFRQQACLWSRVQKSHGSNEGTQRDSALHPMHL